MVEAAPQKFTVDRKELEQLCKRKFFYVPAYEIYGGEAGFYDFGPLGASLKSNVEQLWKQHFIIEEDMLEVSCSNITPENVLKTSGHVEKFSDFMVKDVKGGKGYRADKLIQEHIEKYIAKKKGNIPADKKEELMKTFNECEQYGPEDLNRVIKELKIKSPDTGNELQDAVPFNLMFETHIGPSGHNRGFLKPETSQGIFLNFKRLLEYNNGRMPFASAQIGLGFRNEIAPRQGLLRVREFTMAEIEHFVDPNIKDHPKFNSVADLKLPLLSAENQQGAQQIVVNDITLGEAVEQRLIDNQTLGYFMGRTYLFLLSVGLKAQHIRFRQHMSTEMAHYAKDCWDAEVETSYGWIEVAGHADRSAFDLTRHGKATKTELVASNVLKEPKTVETIKVILDKKNVSKTFKKDSKVIFEFFESLTDEEKKPFMEQLAEGKVNFNANGTDFELTPEMIKMENSEIKIFEEKYTPSVIEPSFGIGRIIYCIFEHCFKVREHDAQWTYFDFPPQVAPVKCFILPLTNSKDFLPLIEQVRQIIKKEGLNSRVDDSMQTIGRRYARADQAGTPFALTIDFDSFKDQTVTLREMDTTKQIRLPIQEVGKLIKSLADGQTSWQDALDKYPVFEFKAEEEQ